MQTRNEPHANPNPDQKPITTPTRANESFQWWNKAASLAPQSGNHPELGQGQGGSVINANTQMAVYCLPGTLSVAGARTGGHAVRTSLAHRVRTVRSVHVRSTSVASRVQRWDPQKGAHFSEIR